MFVYGLKKRSINTNILIKEVYEKIKLPCLHFPFLLDVSCAGSPSVDVKGTD